MGRGWVSRGGWHPLTIWHRGGVESLLPPMSMIHLNSQGESGSARALSTVLFWKALKLVMSSCTPLEIPSWMHSQELRILLLFIESMSQTYMLLPLASSAGKGFPCKLSWVLLLSVKILCGSKTDWIRSILLPPFSLPFWMKCEF